MEDGVCRWTFYSSLCPSYSEHTFAAGGGDDFMAWAHEKSGIYIVKSAYRSLVNKKECFALEEGTGTGASTDNTELWRALWKLNVIPKVRVFYWRVLRGIIPVKCTLKHRHIQELGRCKICMAMDEDLAHALIHCSHAKQFWVQAQQLLDFSLPKLHPSTWSHDILCDQLFSEKKRAIIATVMWAIWHSRNRLTHDQEKLDPSSSVRCIKEDLAILDIPRQDLKILPGYGWRP